MLREVTNTVQYKKPPRRWFTSAYFDLIVWYGNDNNIAGFELCYGKPNNEKALCWLEEKGYSHFKVNNGESEPLNQKMAPVYMTDKIFDKNSVLQIFIKDSKHLDQTVKKYIIEKNITNNFVKLEIEKNSTCKKRKFLKNILTF